MRSKRLVIMKISVFFMIKLIVANFDEIKYDNYTENSKHLFKIRLANEGFCKTVNNKY